MRRNDREVKSLQTIKYILGTGKVLHLGLIDNGKPYIVPMNYGYEFENKKLVFYVHSALEGRKIEILRKNPSCCVQIECDTKLIEGQIACKYGYSFYSFEGFGSACFVENSDEKIRALKLLMFNETGSNFEFTEEMTSNVAVIKIVCDSYTAKHRAMPV